MEKTPLSISAVIPAYNCEKYVGRAIESVLNQTLPVQEVIVVDDGSSDGTAEVVRAFGDKVILIRQPNAGVSAARNAGIRAATGDWIAFLDADDEWLPEKIRLQTELLNRNPDLMWMTGNYEEHFSQENRKAPHTLPLRCEELLCEKEYYESYLYAVQLYQEGHTICMLIRREVFEEVGLFPTDISLAEDMDMWLRIGYRYPKVGFSATPLAVYHLSFSQSLMTADRSRLFYVTFMERHFNMAASEHRQKEFTPAASAIMRRWIRGMLFEGAKEEIRELLMRFPRAFSPAYRGMIYALTIFPEITAKLLHLLSKLIRTFKLRRRITRPPQKPS